jgi:Signal transduction histidine kinase
MIRKLHLLAFLAVAFATTVRANVLGYTKEHPLIFGIDLDYPPMEFVSESGEPHGYDIQFTRELMRRLDIPFTFSPNTWKNISGDVIHGRVDLGMMVYSPYRKDITNYSRAVFRLYYQVVYRKTKHHERFDIRNLKNKTVAYMASKPITDTLSHVGANIQVVDDLAKAFKDLSKGQYDAVICFRYQAKYIIGTYGLDNLHCEDLTLMPREYCYVSHNKALINAINDELDNMERDGVIQAIYGDHISTFASREIPRWVWYLLGALIFGFMVFVIIQQSRYQRRLRKEVRRAQRSEHLKTIFLGNVSHALRTPLNAILGFSDMLRKDDEQLSTGERQEMLRLINSNGQQLLHFIEELLELSNIEGKDQLFDRSEIDLHESMEEFAEAVRPNLHEGVDLKVKGRGGRIVLDYNLLRYVVIHLLNNAVEYTHEGEIILKYGDLKHGFYVEVRDTGTGIPEDLRKNLFSLLSEKNTYVQNTVPGLGLSICKAIIERTGGQIGTESPKEGGTIVWFWAPREIIY